MAQLAITVDLKNAEKQEDGEERGNEILVVDDRTEMWDGMESPSPPSLSLSLSLSFAQSVHATSPHSFTLSSLLLYPFPSSNLIPPLFFSIFS